MPTEDIATMFREQWLKAGIIFESVSGSFINVAMELLKNGTELVANSGNHLLSILHYPLKET
ncbi:glutamate--tRNA ligase, chloroplastic/mitochondrial-like [Physcomitrium patens]|uniref:glutamate--tRNA ligase, chloroplastic/mitochondrial-like n=1 Tax=Physcomitrium patens TaxID=3218 RepID=UPI003CCD40F6